MFVPSLSWQKDVVIFSIKRVRPAVLSCICPVCWLVCRLQGAEWTVEPGGQWVWTPRPHQKGQRPLRLNDEQPGLGKEKKRRLAPFFCGLKPRGFAKTGSGQILKVFKLSGHPVLQAPRAGSSPRSTTAAGKKTTRLFVPYWDAIVYKSADFTKTGSGHG
jgi:hypothetical protein